MSAPSIAIAENLAGPEQPLEFLLHPLKVAEFVRDYWNREFLALEGDPDRFEHLFPWAKLNEVLSCNRLRSPRLRLAHRGKIIDARQYIQPNGNELRISPATLYDLLGQGATLIIDSVDELNPPLHGITSALEAWARSRVNANLYASWREDQGFKLHWDAQDTFIVQVLGRKHWTVYRSTKDHPADGESIPEPTGEPVFDRPLEPGGLLYIPRGWWHLVRPVGEPCLHLTVTFNLHKGSDLLRWAVDRCRASTWSRMDLPIHASAAEQQRFAEKLLREFVGSLKPEDLLKYLNQQDERALGQPHFQLPEAVDEQYVPSLEDQIRLTCTRKMIAGEDDTLHVQSQTIPLAPRLIRALQMLSIGQTLPIKIIVQQCELAEGEVLAAMSTLTKLGIIEVLPRTYHRS